jgi:hypothetical protein
MVDPRRILERAAENRVPCEVLPRAGRRSEGEWQRGIVLRVERGGVVVRLARAPDPGTDVRVWVSVDGTSWTFEASVLRVGVPVPDRSQDGVLLGYLDNVREAPRTGPAALSVELLPPSGAAPVALEGGGAHVVELSPTACIVSLPRAFPVVLAVQADVTLRVALSDRAPIALTARVAGLAQGESHLVYTLHVVRVQDAERWPAIVAAARETLGL